MVSKYIHQSFTDYCKLRDELFNNLYLETPEEWHLFVKACVFEIYDICRDDGLDIRKIAFEQIKEKYGTLRIYYTTPYQNLFVDIMFEGRDSEVTEGIFYKQNILTDKIDYVISKYDILVRKLKNATEEMLYNLTKDILSPDVVTQTQSTNNATFTIDKHVNNKL
jgi:hypothetical protein